VSAVQSFFVLPAGDQLDAASVSAVVVKFALNLGCTDSDATASAAYGIHTGHDTLSAIRAGKHRAEQLRDRELTRALRSCDPNPAA
jgi:hypothetical protein